MRSSISLWINAIAEDEPREEKISIAIADICNVQAKYLSHRMRQDDVWEKQIHGRGWAYMQHVMHDKLWDVLLDEVELAVSDQSWNSFDHSDGAEFIDLPVMLVGATINSRRVAGKDPVDLSKYSPHH
ncbi:hypothetical protein ACA910_003114 [Epithemia clementina (nom. ined.)]